MIWFVIGGLVVFFGALAFATMIFIRKVEPGYIGVRVGFLGYVISDTWIFGIPFLTTYKKMDISVKKLEIERKGQDGLICEDNIRADIVVAFYIKVNYPKVDYGMVDPNSVEGQALAEQAMNNKNRFDDIRKVAQTVGCDRASDVEKLRELFEAKFSEALKTAGKGMEFQKLYTERTDFRDDIKKVIGHDLNGYALEDVAIDYLEQTPLDSLDKTNVLDAQGIKKITEITSEEQETTNERVRRREVEIENQDIRAIKDKRELEADNEKHMAEQTRIVDERKAEESAAARRVVEENRQTEEMSILTREKNVNVHAQLKIREEKSAEIKVEQEVLVLDQMKMQEAEIAKVSREELVGLKDADREAKIIAAAFEIAKSKAGLEGEEKKVTDQHQQRLDLEADMSAARAARVLNVEFEARAQADQKKDIIAAEAEKTVRQERAEAGQIEQRVAALAKKEAAEHEAEQIQITADAEAKASEKRNHAMQQEAQGTAAMEAASGVAEANVVKAMADAKIADSEAEKALGLAEAAVIEKQGEATGSALADKGKGEGEAISAKGTAEGSAIESVKLAEALGKTEMAKAVGAMNAAGKEHEEFRLNLNKDLEVDLAEIAVTKDIAEAQARVVGEALKSANIDIVGGEHDFFEKVVKSVIQGRSIDRLMNNSQTLTDVKNTFFTGDPDHFKGQLRNWIQDLGISSEDVKNLTVAAALTKLMSAADDSGTKSLIRQAQKAAKESGITDIVVSALLGDKAGK
jgi:flotillin